MKTILNLLIILGFLFFSSCNSSHDEDKKQSIEVSFDLKNAESDQFDSVFQIQEVFPLLGSEDVPIKRVKRLIKQEKSYWLLAPDLILLTDLEGRVIRTISDKGQGPGEFQSLDDIRWNESSQLMEVLDRTSGKLISYNVAGDFQKEWKNRFLYTSLSFFPLGKEYLIYGGAFFDGEGDRLILVSPESGEKTNGFLPINNERNFLNVLNHDVFFGSQSGVELFFSDRDTIYSIATEQVFPLVTFNAGSNKVPREVYQRNFTNIMEYREELKKQNYVTLFTIQPTNKHYYLRFRHQSDFYPAILEKSSGKLKLIKAWDSGFGTEFEDLSSYFTLAPIGSEKDHIYFSIDPYEVKSTIEKLKDHPNLSAFLKANPRIREIYEQFDNYENPYILKLSIREF